MSLEREFFQKRQVDLKKLEGYGFVKTKKGYQYEESFMDGDFTAIVEVSPKGKVSGKVIDHMSEEEYLPLRIPDATGTYVSTVRYEYSELLGRIADACCIPMPFVSDQANRITALIQERYGDAPEFPWDKPGVDDAGVFRNPDSRKWYGLIMHISEGKLLAKTAVNAAETSKSDKTHAVEAKGRKARKNTSTSKETETAAGQEASDVMIDVLNVKIDEDEGDALRAIPGIYPAYHMNHKSWITIRLDDTVSDEVIMERIEASHVFSQKGKAGAKKRGETHKWIVPANLKYYDIITDFDENDTSDWKQGKGIEVGDEVYMYVGAPYSAILYKCVVTKTHIPYRYEGAINVPELMGVKIVARYPKEEGKFDLKSVMTRFGVTTVRGPRFMPEELISYIESRMQNK